MVTSTSDGSLVGFCLLHQNSPDRGKFISSSDGNYCFDLFGNGRFEKRVVEIVHTRINIHDERGIPNVTAASAVTM